MPDLCGYLTTTGAAAPAARLVDALAPREPLVETARPAPDAPGAWLAGRWTATDDAGLAATITGRPRWTDRELAGVASSRGHAAALIQAFRERGTDLFEVLHGQFTLALTSTGDGRALLALDRLGHAELFHATAGPTFVFASRAAAVLALPSLQRELLDQGIFHYLYFHMVPSPGSVWHGLTKVPGGHYVEFRDGVTTTTRYWLPRFDEHDNTPVDELGEELLSLLETGVRRALEGEQRVGAFLSGGLDSSSVVGMLSRVGREDARAYTIGFPLREYDERHYARTAASHFGVELREYEMTPEDVVSAVPEIAASYDEPFGNSSALPAYFCAKLAREDGVDCLLAGDGGDELFAGNTRYARQFIFELYNTLPALMRRGLLEPMADRAPWLDTVPLVRKVFRYVVQARIPLPDRLDTYNFLHRMPPREFFTDDFLASIDLDEPLARVRETYHAPRDASALNRMLFLDWKRTLQDNDLVKVNSMCALAGVDVAYPMLDEDLVSFSCRVSSRLKLKGQRIRHFYKLATRGFLPDEILEKPKHGFGLPFGLWTREHAALRELAYDSVRDLDRRGYFRDGFLARAIDLHRGEHAAYYGELIWILMMLSLWLRSHEI